MQIPWYDLCNTFAAVFSTILLDFVVIQIFDKPFLADVCNGHAFSGEMLHQAI